MAVLEEQLATLIGAPTAAANPGKGYVPIRRSSTEGGNGAKKPLSEKMEQMVETVGAMVPNAQAVRVTVCPPALLCVGSRVPPRENDDGVRGRQGGGGGSEHPISVLEQIIRC